MWRSGRSLLLPTRDLRRRKQSVVCETCRTHVGAMIGEHVALPLLWSRHLWIRMPTLCLVNGQICCSHFFVNALISCRRKVCHLKERSWLNAQWILCFRKLFLNNPAFPLIGTKYFRKRCVFLCFSRHNWWKKELNAIFSKSTPTQLILLRNSLATGRWSDAGVEENEF